VIPKALRLFEKARKKKFVQDTAVMQLASVVTAMTYLVTSVLIGRHLGDEQLGRWGVARELYAMVFMTLSAGLVQVSVAAYAKALGAQQRREAIDSLAALLKLYFCTASLVLIAGVSFAPMVAERAYGDREVGIIAAVLCATGFGEAIKSLLIVAVQGSRWMVEYARFEITINIVRLGLIAVVVWQGYGLFGVMWAFVGHSLVVSVWSLVVYRRLQRSGRKNAPPPLDEVLGAVRGASVKKLFNTAYFLSIFKVMNALIPGMGKVLIPMAGVTVSGSFKEGGHYVVAYVVANALGMLCDGITKALLPALGLKVGEQNKSFDEMGRLIFRVTVVSGVLVTVAAAISIPVMRVAFGLLWGEEFADAAEFYPWLAMGVALSSFAVAVDPFYIYSGRMSSALRQNIVYGPLAVGMIVTGAVTHGPMGVAVATGLVKGLGVLHLVYIWRYFHSAAARRASS
jgi:O-antigen/teichoic acid export membrane protein